MCVLIAGGVGRVDGHHPIHGGRASPQFFRRRDGNVRSQHESEGEPVVAEYFMSVLCGIQWRVGRSLRH